MIIAIFFNTYMHSLNNAQYKVLDNINIGEKGGGGGSKTRKNS